MLETLKNAFKIKDVRRRIYYVVLMLVIVRIGSQLPIPGVDRDFFKQLFANQSNDAFNFFNAFTGGSFETMSIFALSITPYITSSIIIQLLTIAIPKLEEMQRDGEEGRKKMTANSFSAVPVRYNGNRIWKQRMAYKHEFHKRSCCGCHFDSRFCYVNVDWRADYGKRCRKWYFYRTVD